jgi:DinB superfamily
MPNPDRAALVLARFNAAQNHLVSKLRDMPPAAAEDRPDVDTWSAAQIGWHVALTNDWIAGVLTGATPLAEPAPPGFRETLHSTALPDKLKTFPTLEPPAIVGRDSALERLRASGQHMAKAIASLTAERGSAYIVTLPYGTLSLFEFADFAAGHVARHIAQLERVGAGA